MLLNLSLFFCFGCILQYYAYAASNRFTNIECVTHDKSFSDFKECKLKVLGRGIIAMSLHVRLYQLPVTNSTINLSLHKKYSGYRPFMYNQTLDFCKLMSNKKPTISFVKIFFDAVMKNSNINHTCPYDHDLIISNMIVKDEYLKYAPFPSGEYKFQLKVAAYNDWKATVSAYVSRIE